MAFVIDFEEHEVCNLHCRLETLWLKVFLLPPATRMLLATLRNPAAGHGRQLIPSPPILFTQARIKHVETDDLSLGRFGWPHGRVYLFRARRRAAQNRHGSF